MMATGKKQILIAVYEILRQYSDAGHPLSIGQVGDMLSGVYGICAERKAISRNIRLLKEMGYDLHLHGEAGQEGYYLQSRPFSDEQLRLVMEGVFSSRYIQKQQAQELANRLSGLSTVHFSNCLRQVKRLNHRCRAGADALFENLERLGEAIERQRKLCFCRQSYGLDGRLYPWAGSKHRVSPYELVCDGEFYYLLAAEDGADCVDRYRVDKMTQIELMEDKARDRKTLPDGGRQTHQAKRAVLRMDRSHIDEVVDVFGADTPMRAIDSRSFEFSVDAPLETMALWAMRFAAEVTVVEPPELKALLARQAKLIYDRFAEAR